MKRREFIALIGGVAVATPLGARAQQSGKLPTIGVLASGTSAVQGPWWAGFAERLHVLSWIEGRTATIEYRWAENRPERFREIAAEFARLKVDVIATSGTAATAAAKQATSVIPIVFALAGDPVGTGLVASLARPGGNATGLSLQVTDLGGKRLELLREVVPALSRLAILVNINNPATVLDMSETEVQARTLGLEVVHRAPALACAASAHGSKWHETADPERPRSR
jgi:putative tryptophan/tyrosine transport system substrate-binding protein